MEFAEHAAQDCRLIILKALADEHDHRLNENMIVPLLKTYGHTKSREYVRTQIRKLGELGAIAVTEAGTVLVAELKQPGLDHLERSAFLDGVRKPSLGG